MKYRIFALAVVLMGCPALARAQQPLRLQIAGGKVTLHAQGVPVRAILTEWARLGGAQIVGGDRVVGTPVTLDLENVPERQALDIILRGVSGYMLAAREPGAPGSSMYDRIMILPTSAPIRSQPGAGSMFSNTPTGVGRPIAPKVPDEQDASDLTNGAPGDEDGVPIPRPVAIQRPVPNPLVVPVGPPPPIGYPEDTPQELPPPSGAAVVTPYNPFGLPPGSSSRPGVITPAPAPPTSAPRNGQAN